MDWEAPLLTKKLSARHVMAKNVVVLKEKNTVGQILDTLSASNHHGFPVVEDVPQTEGAENFGLLKGFILRHQLFTLLKKKVHLSHNKWLTNEDFVQSYPRYLTMKDININDDELEMEIDLRPYMNLAPFSLTENSNLPRIFRLFRGLGLRHLVIVDDHNRVVGIITRIDIAKFKTHVGLNHSIVKELSVKYAIKN